jgi:Zn-dependent metalloprotease/subtilisin-like proprotein convertase family protein
MRYLKRGDSECPNRTSNLDFRCVYMSRSDLSSPILKGNRVRFFVALASVTALAGSTLVATATSATAAPPKPNPSAVARADQALRSHSTAVRAGTGDAYRADRTVVDRNGSTHVRYTRTYHGLRVTGGDFVVHTTKDGAFAGASVGLDAPLTLDTTPTVTSTQAHAAAEHAFHGTITATGTPELLVDASTGSGVLAWETVVSGWQPDGQLPSRLHVIVNASTGAVIGSYDEIEAVAGTGNTRHAGAVAIDTTQTDTGYALLDPSHGLGSACDMHNDVDACEPFTDADNVWGDGTAANRQTAAAEAYYGAANTFDYFKNVHGREGILGDGNGVYSRVHYGTSFENAFWDGTQMTYGDGLNDANPYTTLDITAHEMTHGVTEALVVGGMHYPVEAGGLNEATSDIFGTMAEFYANNATDVGDYNLGDTANVNGDGTPIRYMWSPNTDGYGQSCWSTATNTVDPHNAAGVGDHFYFDLAEGTGATAYGYSSPCGTARGVTGIGRAKAEKIWYRALEVYFTTSTRYVDPGSPSNTARAGTLAAAADLYGSCSTEYRAVQAAWSAVNVAGNDYCVPLHDFSISVSPSTALTDPGRTLTATVTTVATNGTPERVILSAGDLPPGVTAFFTPNAVTAGGTSTVTLTVAPAAVTGLGNITIIGTAPTATHTTPFPLTINSRPGCMGADETDQPIPDGVPKYLEAPLTFAGCAGNGSANSLVDVDIVHPYVADLVLTLVTPTGGEYQLRNRSGGNSHDVKETYTVDLSTRAVNGTWKLRVWDAATGDVGYLNRWSLNFGGGTERGTGGPCTSRNDTDVATGLYYPSLSPIAFTGCTGLIASATASVTVHIVHPAANHLEVRLRAPDGTLYLLRPASADTAINLDESYTLDLSSEPTAGTWLLWVTDCAIAPSGYIDSWSLTL